MAVVATSVVVTRSARFMVVIVVVAVVIVVVVAVFVVVVAVCVDVVEEEVVVEVFGDVVIVGVVVFVAARIVEDILNPFLMVIIRLVTNKADFTAFFTSQSIDIDSLEYSASIIFVLVGLANKTHCSLIEDFTRNQQVFLKSFACSNCYSFDY